MRGSCFLLFRDGWSSLSEHLTLQRRRHGAQIVRTHRGQDRARKKNGFCSSHIGAPASAFASVTAPVLIANRRRPVRKYSGK